jgi:hypothetical protein
MLFLAFLLFGVTILCWMIITAFGLGGGPAIGDCVPNGYTMNLTAGEEACPQYPVAFWISTVVSIIILTWSGWQLVNGTAKMHKAK